MTNYYKSLIRKHSSRGILIDTNLLLLYLIGMFDENYINRFKRTKKYSIDDFKIVKNIINYFRKIIVTPQILAEISNLSKDIKDPFLSKYFSKLIDIIKDSEELYINKNDLLKPLLLPKYGFTDVSIIESADVHNHLIFTDDFPLSGYLCKYEMDVFNFNHIRTEMWSLK